MAALETPAPKPAAACPSHRRRRTGVRIDTTPTVDIALLLPIFFMVTAVFLQPQAMEVIPPPHLGIPVPDSSVLILKVGPSSDLHWRMGSNEPLQRTWMRDSHQLFLDPSRLNPELVDRRSIHGFLTHDRRTSAAVSRVRTAR